MFCPKCGNKIKDGIAFCGKCGNQIKTPRTNLQETTKQESANSNKTKVVNQPVNSTPTYVVDQTKKMPKQTNGSESRQQANIYKPQKVKKTTFKLKPWQLGLVIGGSVLVLAIIIGVIIWVCIVARQSDETRAKTDIENSWVVSEGVVSNDYCKKNSYRLDDFEVGNIVANPNGSTKKEVNFSATIINDNFQSEIEGSVNYSNSDRVEVKVSHKDTIPIKGVDFLQKTEDEAKSKMEGEKTEGGAKNATSSNSTSSSISAYTSYTTFTSYTTSSPLVRDGSKYKCEATADRTIERWFVKDKANVKQSFEFDQQNGWKSSGKETLENKRVEYTLNGVEMVSASTESEAGSHKLVFNSIDDNGNGAVNYTVTYKPSNTYSSSSSTTQYHNINLTGTAKGTISHTYGETWFKFEFSDSSKGVSFVGDDTTYYSSYYSTYGNNAGDPREDYCMQCSITTNADYMTYSSSRSSSSNKFKREHLLFKKNDA